MPAEAAAEAIIKVSISGMFLEVSKLFSRQGADPRQFALLPFGGAGPMTACLLARDLGVGRIIVPPTPGVLAAFGGLIADIRNDFIQTVFAELDAAGTRRLADAFTALETRARAWLRDEQRYPGEARLLALADMRYRGQSYEIEVPLEAGWIRAADAGAIAGAFHREHARVYDHADERAPVQVVNLKVVALGPSPQPALSSRAVRAHSVRPTATTRAWLDGRWQEAGIYDRAELEPGAAFEGPGIVRQGDCTTCIIGGFAAAVDGHGNLVIDRKA
jgi:N-methylhydantoinase A